MPEDRKWREFCPMMKEICINGHTAFMGSDSDGEPIRCAFWVKIRGIDPNTQKEVDEGRCATNWLPMLLVENANVGRQTAASVDKVASEVALVRETPILLPEPKKLEIEG